MKRDNDIIKALGFVTLYAAYVEESIDVVMERLSLTKEITDKDRCKPSSTKIKWCVKVIRSMKNEELNELIKLLENTCYLLERRNEIIHGRHYQNDDRSTILKSGRINVPDREATAEELYDLAEDLFSMQAVLANQHYIATMRAINEFNNA